MSRKHCYPLNSKPNCGVAFLRTEIHRSSSMIIRNTTRFDATPQLGLLPKKMETI